MPIRSHFSRRQAGERVAVDVLALSPQARRFEVVLNASPAAPICVTNSTQYLTFTATRSLRVISAYVNFVVVPVVSGGTGTLAIDKVATDGSTTVSMVAAADILSGYTAKIPVAQTLAATNPTSITVGESIMVSVVISNNAVGTPDKGASITLLCEPVEDTVINDTNTAV